jgi:hypothetical protein
VTRAGHVANSFERRIVALVDILGFREIVEQARTDTRLFEIVRDVLNTIDEQARRLKDYRLVCNPRPSHRASLLRRTDVRMAAFSDCYLISDECSEEVAGEQVMTAAQSLGSHLLAQDIFTRGAVVCGDAYHDDRVAFGPAIAEAYSIGQNVAKHPRIIVTEEVYEALHWEDQVFWEGQMVRRDSDGFLFINAFAPPLSAMEAISNDTTGCERAEFLDVVRTKLEDRRKSLLRTMGHPEFLKRLTSLRWMIHQFNLEAREHQLPLIADSVDVRGELPHAND